MMRGPSMSLDGGISKSAGLLRELLHQDYPDRKYSLFHLMVELDLQAHRTRIWNGAERFSKELSSILLFGFGNVGQIIRDEIASAVLVVFAAKQPVNFFRVHTL